MIEAVKGFYLLLIMLVWSSILTSGSTGVPGGTHLKTNSVEPSIAGLADLTVSFRA